jgi:hypothetical protein
VQNLAWNINIKQTQAHYCIVDGKSLFNYRQDFLTKHVFNGHGEIIHMIQPIELGNGQVIKENFKSTT